MIERITGPFNGYHIAAYACPMGDMGQEYLGQYKISRKRPNSFLDDGCLLVGGGDELWPTCASAIQAAESRAMLQIDGLGFLAPWAFIAA